MKFKGIWGTVAVLSSLASGVTADLAEAMGSASNGGGSTSLKDPHPFTVPGDGFVMDLALYGQSMSYILSVVAESASLGARHFLIPVVMCQDGKESSDVTWCHDGVLQKAEAVALELRKLGHTFGYFPFLMCRDGTWRGEAFPTDFTRWGAGYKVLLEETFSLHLRVPGEEFFLGTEMNRFFTGRPEYWQELLKSFRSRTLAPVLIVANWDQWDKVKFWEDSDAIGLSSYYPLATSVSDPTDVDTLVDRWKGTKKKLLELSRKVKRPLYFSEVGYGSVVTAAAQPWAWGSTADQDLGLQARLFEAFGKAWSPEKELARFTVWGMNHSANPLLDKGYSVFGKPAAAALAGAYKARPHGR